MFKLFCIICFIGISWGVPAQSMPKDSITGWENVPFRVAQFRTTPAYQIVKSGVPLMLSSALALSVDKQIQRTRDTHISGFSNEFDNYLQYAPAAAMLGMKLAGVKGRSTWWEMITADAVEQNVGISKEYNTFELVNAIANKDKVKVFKIIEYFRANPKKGPGVLAASTLFTFFSNLLIAFYARTTDERALMEALRLKSPFQLKDYRICMKHYTATQSMNAIVALREFDTRSKGIGSNRNEYDLVEELILKIFDA